MNRAQREQVERAVSHHISEIENLRGDVLEILEGPDSPERRNILIYRRLLDYEGRQWDYVIAEKELAGGEGPANRI